MKEFISKLEFENYLKKQKTKTNAELELFEIFENLTQEIREYKIHFIDKRQATLFVITRLSNDNLYVRKYFEAPLISLADLYKLLPIPPSKVTFFTEWITAERTSSYADIRAFYEDESRAFKIPINDLINDKMKYEFVDKKYVAQHSIIDKKIILDETDWALTIEIQMDKYNGGRLLRDLITTKYKVDLKTLEIVELSFTSETYSVK
jgi:hypothetical protein